MAAPPTVWDGVLQRLASELPAPSFEAWIQPLAAREEPGRLLLLAPTPFHRERVRTRFLPVLLGLASELGGGALEVEVELGPEASAPPAPVAVLTATAARPPEPAPLRARAATPFAQLTLPYTFETFVTGAANALAREASLAVAQGRQPSLFPLFLVGESGIGKSHLARA